MRFTLLSSAFRAFLIVSSVALAGAVCPVHIHFLAVLPSFLPAIPQCHTPNAPSSQHPRSSLPRFHALPQPQLSNALASRQTPSPLPLPPPLSNPHYPHTLNTHTNPIRLPRINSLAGLLDFLQYSLIAHAVVCGYIRGLRVEGYGVVFHAWEGSVLYWFVASSRGEEGVGRRGACA
jgi:hypothetical protein